MRWWAIGLLALFLMPSVTVAENMAAAAEREQKRRQELAAKDNKTESFDEQDLTEAREKRRRDGTPVASPSPTKPAPPGLGPVGPDGVLAMPPSGAVPSDRSGDSQPKASDEYVWKSRAREARARVRSAERSAQAAEKARDDYRKACLRSGYCSASDLARSSGALDDAQARLYDAKEELDAIEDEARRSSIPPGWLRD